MQLEFRRTAVAKLANSKLDKLKDLIYIILSFF